MDKKDVKKLIIPSAISIPVGIAAYKYLRKPVYSDIDFLNKIQKGNTSGKFTVISPTFFKNPDAPISTGITSVLRRLIAKVRMPGIKIKNPEALEDGQKFKGTVINIAHEKDIQGDVTINPFKTRDDASKLFNQDIKENIDLGKFKWTPKTKILSEALKPYAKKKIVDMDDTELLESLKQLAATGDYYVKPKGGEESIGLYNSLSNILENKKNDYAIRYPDNPLKSIKKGADEYLLQDNLQPVKEFRIHTLGPHIIGKPQLRKKQGLKGEGWIIKKPEEFNDEQFTADLNALLKSRKLENEPHLIGWDMAVTKDGQVKVIEANTASEFAFDSARWSRTDDIYKDLTGRMSPKRAILGSSAAALPVGLAAHYITTNQE